MRESRAAGVLRQISESGGVGPGQGTGRGILRTYMRLHVFRRPCNRQPQPNTAQAPCEDQSIPPRDQQPRYNTDGMVSVPRIRSDDEALNLVVLAPKSLQRTTNKSYKFRIWTVTTIQGCSGHTACRVPDLWTRTCLDQKQHCIFCCAKSYWKMVCQDSNLFHDVCARRCALNLEIAVIQAYA